MTSPRTDIISLAAVLFLLACGDVTEPQLGYGGGDYKAHLTSGGRTRTYWLHVPPAITAERAVPLVIVLHGLGQDGNAIRALSGFDAVADEHAVLVAYPDKAEDLTPTWSYYGFPTGGIDDAKFMVDLIDELSATFSIDSDRVYLAGYSNGGLFAHQLGCQLRGRLAAIASVASSLNVAIRELCTPASIVPAVFFHGTQDQAFPWSGTPDFMAPQEMVALWAQLNGCTSGPTVTVLSDVVNDGTTVQREDYHQCSRSERVSLYVTVGGVHAWPRSAELSASEEVMAFFEEVRP